MGPLSEDGSLEREEEAWVQNHRRRYSDLFDSCNSLSRHTLRFLLDLHMDNRDRRQLITSSLLARCFQLHLACLQTVQRGLEAPSDVILRALLEAVFILGAIARHPDVLERYIADDDILRLKLLHEIRATKSDSLAPAKAAATDELRNELETKVRSGLPVALDAKELSRLAGLPDWYVMVYRVVSPATHTTARDIERYFVLNDAGDAVDALRLTPSDAETPRLLKTAGSVLLTALNATGFVFAIDVAATTERYRGVFENQFVAP